MMTKRREAQVWLQGNFPGESSLFSYCSIVFKRGTSTCLEAEQNNALEEERICLRKMSVIHMGFLRRAVWQSTFY